MKVVALAIVGAIALSGCGESGSFPRDETVEVSIERTSWSQSQLSGEWESRTSTFELSSVTLTEDSFSSCLKSTTDIPIMGSDRILYEANQEYCSEYAISEWDENRFLARHSTDLNVGFSIVCETGSDMIDCYTVPDRAPAEVKLNPREYYVPSANPDAVFVFENSTYSI